MNRPPLDADDLADGRADRSPQAMAAEAFVALVLALGVGSLVVWLWRWWVGG